MKEKKSKKKIIIIYQYFGSKNTKWSTRWYDFAIALSKKYNVTIITSNFVRSDFPNVRVFKRIHIDRINIEIYPFGDGNNYSFFRRIVNSIFFSFIITFRLLFSNYEKYIFSVGPITASFASLFISRNKTIVEFRDLWPDGAFEMNKLPLLFKPFLFHY